MAVAMMAAKVAVVSEAREGEQGASEAGRRTVCCLESRLDELHNVHCTGSLGEQDSFTAGWRYPTSNETIYSTCVPLRSPAEIGRPFVSLPFDKEAANEGKLSLDR